MLGLNSFRLIVENGHRRYECVPNTTAPLAYQEHKEDTVMCAKPTASGDSVSQPACTLRNRFKEPSTYTPDPSENETINDMHYERSPNRVQKT